MSRRAASMSTDLDAVFNYELPKQAEIYVHRIGRTARAGLKGVAVSLVEEREGRRLENIGSLFPDATITQSKIPDADHSRSSLAPRMTTIQINGGRRNKLRPGDVLGALTAEGGVRGEAVGSIDLLDTCGYVAVRNSQVAKALQQLSSRPIKGRRYRARVRK